jgi:hypothetical protein
MPPTLALVIVPVFGAAAFGVAFHYLVELKLVRGARNLMLGMPLQRKPA